MSTRSMSSFTGQRMALAQRRHLCSAGYPRRSRITMMPEGPEVRAVVDQLQGGIGRRLVDVRFVSGRYVRHGPPDGFRAFAATMTPAKQKQKRRPATTAKQTTMTGDWFERANAMEDDEEEAEDASTTTTTTSVETAATPDAFNNLDVIQEWNCKGKFIYLILDNGATSMVDDEDFQRSIWITLGMSGRFLSEKALKEREAEGKKNHVRWYLELMEPAQQQSHGEEVDDDGPPTTTSSKMTKIFYSDARNFGTLKFCLSRQELVEKLEKLGPDMLSTSTTEQDFLNVMAAHKNQAKNICKFLMDQSNLAGIGNYILAEGLYRANIDPFASLNELDLEQQRTLFRELQAVTKESYASQNNESEESFEFQCYGQQFCRRRGDPVHKEVQGPHGRTIWYTDAQTGFVPRRQQRVETSQPSKSAVRGEQTAAVAAEDGEPPQKRSMAADADTPGNKKLAALLSGKKQVPSIEKAKVAPPKPNNTPKPENTPAISEDEAKALAFSLLDGIKDPGWKIALSHDGSLLQKLAVFLEEEKRQGVTVYPPRDEIFAALNLCPLESVKVVILGQDPYHGAGQGHGLAFSVRKRVRPPPSLLNIFKELIDDVGISDPKSGNLEHWARQGVLLLNAVLTVQEGKANSHAGKGWEDVTDHILRAVSEKNETVGSSGLVFLLWGNAAAKKVGGVIDEDSGHTIIQTSHPSPLGATKTKSPFLGSKCFSRANEALRQMQKDPIDWNVD